MPEIYKNALSSLRSEEANTVTTGANRCPEHEIEGEGLGDVVLGVWSLDSILGQLLIQLCCTHIIKPAQSFLYSLQVCGNSSTLNHMHN